MEQDIQLVACTIEGEEYAIEIGSVQEIIRMLSITRVPHASPCIAGVINLRGMVIPVIDIRKKFGLPEKAPDETTRIIIVNRAGILAGILVDGVSEVIRLSRQNLEHPPACTAKVSTEYFTGIGKIGNRLLIILNLDRIMEVEPGA